METREENIGWHIRDRISSCGQMVAEYLLKKQAYPSYEGMDVWDDILADHKNIALLLAKEFALCRSAAREDVESLYDYLHQEAFGQIGLGWLGYGPQEHVVDLQLVETELRELAAEMAKVMGKG